MAQDIIKAKQMLDEHESGLRGSKVQTTKPSS